MALLARSAQFLFVFAASLFLATGCGGGGDPPAEKREPAGPQMQLDLAVRGMTCQNCMNTIERALSRCAGVEEVHVDLEKGLAVAAGRALDAHELVGAVEEAGYSASVLQAERDGGGP